MALRTWERDVEAGGSLMAAALAFRTFLWTLPAILFVVGLLGFTVDDNDPGADGGSIRGYTLATVEQAASHAHHTADGFSSSSAGSCCSASPTP